MAFAHPLALLLGLLAVPIVVLYRRRLPLPKEPVGTAMFWQQAIGEDRFRTAWQRWRHGVSLAVQLTLLAVLVLALAEPLVPGPRWLVLVVDNSVTAGVGGGDTMRLKEARQAAVRRLASLRDCDHAAIITTGLAPAVRTTWTATPDVLHKAIASIEPSSEPTQELNQLSKAVALARWMTADKRGGHIVVLSDGCSSAAGSLAGDPTIEWIRPGKPLPNVAVSRLAPRRIPADASRWEVFVEVRNLADAPASCQLMFSHDGKLRQTVPLELPADGRVSKLFTVTASDAATFSVHVDADDAYALDNRAEEAIAPAFGRNADETAEWFSAPEPLDLRPRGQFGTAAETVVARPPWPSPWLYLIGLAITLMIAEWCFYQRRWLA